MSYEPKTTTDHDSIRKWTEERGGEPARISEEEADKDQAGLLRLNFGNATMDYYTKKSLETISWDEFFDTFEQENLLFLYQDETEEGETSRFYKFVRRK